MTASIGNGDDGNERELVFNRLNHDDAERIVAGAPADDDLGALADLVSEIRESSAASVPENTAAAQITAAASAAQGAPVARAEPPRRRRAGILVSAPARALAAALVTLTIGVGSAAAGWLPDPVQRAIASAADTVGVHFPRPGEPGETSATTIPDDGVNPLATTSTTSITSTTSTTAPDPTSITTTTDGPGDGPPPALVGAHVWSGTSCDDGPLEIRYEVTTDGTLHLTSTSDPEADVEVRPDRIEVEFTGGVSVRIDLDEHDWTITEDEDRSCSDDGSDSDDHDGDNDSEEDSHGEGSESGGDD